MREESVNESHADMASKGLSYAIPMQPLKWFLRGRAAPTHTDPAFPYILTSSVDPARMIIARRRRRWSRWAVIAVVVLMTGSFVVARGARTIIFAFRRLSSAVQNHSEVALPIGLIVVAVGSILLLWLLPRWQTAKLRTLAPEARFDKENESRKTLAQIIGGLFVIGTLFSTARTLQVSQEQAATSAQQVQVAREGQITDRFTKAIEQLGNKEKLEVRLGGIYALERIAAESTRDHWPIIEVLTTFVRENSRPESTQPDARKKSMAFPHIRTDIQAILTVVGRRDKTFEKGGQSIDLSDTYLSGADLRGANLSGAYLSKANLSGAYLFDATLSRAYLRDANFHDADLHDTNLSDATLNGADLSVTRGLSQSQFDVALGDSETKLPPNIDRPSSWQ